MNPRQSKCTSRVLKYSCTGLVGSFERGSPDGGRAGRGLPGTRNRPEKMAVNGSQNWCARVVGVVGQQCSANYRIYL